MAKRRRLSLDGIDPAAETEAETGPETGAETASGSRSASGSASGAGRPAAAEGPLGDPRPRPPIAQVVGASAAELAFDEVSGALALAQAEGRMILALPLASIVADHLIRDRIALEDEDMEALRQSLTARGQQTPIEVVDLGEGQYGLISGWRRVRALRDLLGSTGEARFASVLALVRRPADQGAAYVAMVEENEIRAGLSFYERARIVQRAVDTFVFANEKEALQILFSSASYSRRSKIKSFLPIVGALDDALRFPDYIPERTGLVLGQALRDDPDCAETLRAALQRHAPATPEAEADVLTRALARHRAAAQAAARPRTGDAGGRTRDGAGAGHGAGHGTGHGTGDRTGDGAQTVRIAPGLTLRHGPEGVHLSGAAVDAGLVARLERWLRDGQPDG